MKTWAQRSRRTRRHRRRGCHGDAGRCRDVFGVLLVLSYRCHLLTARASPQIDASTTTRCPILSESYGSVYAPASPCCSPMVPFTPGHLAPSFNTTRCIDCIREPRAMGSLRGRRRCMHAVSGFTRLQCGFKSCIVAVRRDMTCLHSLGHYCGAFRFIRPPTEPTARIRFEDDTLRGRRSITTT